MLVQYLYLRALGLTKVSTDVHGIERLLINETSLNNLAFSTAFIRMRLDTLNWLFLVKGLNGILPYPVIQLKM